ncbi:MAG TPA: UDP-N-acetylmuramoyl-tripeptide--D-alanyl-D-alanine ligase [Bacteroidia bacterium]|nr:UDP-N-acetylmuramoyl-tripeptide--D-alanyl-D-alanine ligase [Bacteroidia bacterium]
MAVNISEIHRLFIEAGQKICTDTRKLEKGAIFFALKGPNFNANELAEKAIELGCSYAIIDDEAFAPVTKTILVKDVLETLQALANFHRKTFSIPFLGITGSNGKTTSKELINVVLSKKYRTLATEGNLNNHIGVPLTLLKVTKEHEFAIIEMGANHQGEIDMLCRIAEPDFGVITNIGKAHLEGFGGIEGVKKGKSELYKYIAEKKARMAQRPFGQGKVFLHGDDEILSELSSGNDKITYGTNKLYDVVGKINTSSEQVEFAWKTKEKAGDLAKSAFIKTNIIGVYNYHNLLCAACIGNYFGVSEADINDALSHYQPTNNRSQLQVTANNKLILDYYNANPTSMRAAIENFANIDAKNKMLILGDMLELGEDAAKEHKQIVELLQEKKLDSYYLVGPIFSSVTNSKTFKNSEEAAGFLGKEHVKEKTILIKGSRGIKLELVLPVL